MGSEPPSRGWSAKLARVQNVPEDGDSELETKATQKVETHPLMSDGGSAYSTPPAIVHKGTPYVLRSITLRDDGNGPAV